MVNLWLIMVNKWNNNISGWWFGTWLLFFHILGIRCFRGVQATNQITYEGFHNRGTAIAGWFMMVYFMENPVEIDENWGYPHDSGNLLFRLRRTLWSFTLNPGFTWTITLFLEFVVHSCLNQFCKMNGTCRNVWPSRKIEDILIYPIGSMYAIYGNIYHQYTPNVSIYTIHGSYGYTVFVLAALRFIQWRYDLIFSDSGRKQTFLM